MALISTQPITDNFGNTYPNAYGLINQCNGNKKDKQQMFVLEIYRSQSDINNRPFMQDIIVVSKEEFDVWFSPQGVINNGGNQYASAYNYLMQLTVPETIINENNEEVIVPVLKYQDWELYEDDFDVIPNPTLQPNWGALRASLLAGELYFIYQRIRVSSFATSVENVLFANNVSTALGFITDGILTVRIEAAVADAINILQSIGYTFTEAEKTAWNTKLTQLNFSNLMAI
jgi:hypothetical protein